MTFLFETQLPVRPTRFALETDLLERDYYTHWQGLKKHFRDRRAASRSRLRGRRAGLKTRPYAFRYCGGRVPYDPPTDSSR